MSVTARDRRPRRRRPSAGLGLAVLLTAVPAMLRATETNLYPYARSLTPVLFNLASNPSLTAIIQAADRLTPIVGPLGVLTNNAYARVREGTSWGRPTASDAWACVLSQNQASNYPGVLFDNAGWLKGVTLADGAWGAYLWSLQNTIEFQSSPTDRWVSPAGVTSRIVRVMVGSLGDYAPMVTASNTGPDIATDAPATNAAVEQIARIDLTAFYKLEEPIGLTANLDDTDRDGIPDYADGYDWDGLAANADDRSAGESFRLWTLYLPLCENISNLTLRFEYDGSDPARVTMNPSNQLFQPGPGYLRIWRQDGMLARAAAAVTNGGDYVAPGVYAAVALGFTSNVFAAPLYIEGVNPSGVQYIRVYASTNGTNWVQIDSVVNAILNLDVDLDSDNNDGGAWPARSSAEDTIEESTNAYGKFVFVNHNDDNTNAIPDYADLANPAEGQMVPLVVELRYSAVNWSNILLTFVYDGATNLPNPAAFDGVALGNGFTNYTGARQGTLRLWNITNAAVSRDASRYIRPTIEYQAADLGFSDMTTVKVFHLEGLAENVRATIQVKERMDIWECSDSVRVSVVGPDIAVNGNNNTNNADGLRVGIPDVEFTIDENDDLIEDQRGQDGSYAYNWWWGRDKELPAVPFSAGVNYISARGVEDLSPFVLYAPASLRLSNGTFFLKISSDSLHVYPAVSPASDRRLFLKAKPNADAQIARASQGIEIDNTPRDVSALLIDGTNELVFKAIGDADQTNVILELIVGDAAGHMTRADSLVMTLKKPRKFMVMMSARTGYTAQAYPTEDGRVVSNAYFERFNNATQLMGVGEGRDYDAGKTSHLVNVHGYANNLNGSYESGGEIAIRTFWSGYRGNFVQFSWRGDEWNPFFSLNVVNAFQTSQAFVQYVDNQLYVLRGVPTTNIDVLSHSLGNQVTLDAIRVTQVTYPGVRLIHNLTCIEAAIWGETFWPQSDVSYTVPSTPTNYLEDELKRNSWTFWFRQTAHPVAGGLHRLINSFNPGDAALTWMRSDDCVLRNPLAHYSRPDPTGYRIPYDNEQDDTWTPTGGRNLAHQIPAMVKRDGRILPLLLPDVFIRNIELCQGQQSNPVAVANIDAHSLGWRTTAHSDHWDAPLPNVWLWYEALVNEKSWPIGQE